MQKIKNLAYLVVMLLVLSSCGEYHKVLNKGTVEEQYKMATKMYETQKYSKAIRLFEKATPAYRGKPQMERIQYMVSQSNFNEKNYSLAGYYFERFAKNYPKSSKREEADFLSALSYYKASPSFSLDPTDTDKALVSFQTFIDKYPDSDKLDEANKYYADLRAKLEKKSFEIAKTYYNTAAYDSRNYSASIVAFDNLLSDYLGTKYKEEALYYRLKAAHDFVLKSTKRRKAERIKVAIKAYDKLKRSFPESKFIEDSNVMLATLNKEQEQLVKS
ncbi:outer membrane protein assembly factor BamD [Tenacibaculum aestuariivivum]|uniref:outer membrane protein assembly factor BamD n=1 Tax=Tenacibaculum aestuariivivum TaxID=2006131 RepID=UPI003AB5BEAC